MPHAAQAGAKIFEQKSEPRVELFSFHQSCAGPDISVFALKMSSPNGSSLSQIAEPSSAATWLKWKPGGPQILLTSQRRPGLVKMARWRSGDQEHCVVAAEVDPDGDDVEFYSPSKAAALMSQWNGAIRRGRIGVWRNFARTRSQ